MDAKNNCVFEKIRMASNARVPLASSSGRNETFILARDIPTVQHTLSMVGSVIRMKKKVWMAGIAHFMLRM